MGSGCHRWAVWRKDTLSLPEAHSLCSGQITGGQADWQEALGADSS